jgi:hypothetical protein
MDVEEGFSPIERAATMSKLSVKTARLSAFRAGKCSWKQAFTPSNHLYIVLLEGQTKSGLQKNPGLLVKFINVQLKWSFPDFKPLVVTWWHFDQSNVSLLCLVYKFCYFTPRFVMLGGSIRIHTWSSFTIKQDLHIFKGTPITSRKGSSFPALFFQRVYSLRTEVFLEKFSKSIFR